MLYPARQRYCQLQAARYALDRSAPEPVEGFGLSALQAKQREEGFMSETIRVLGLAGQAEVRILILDPNDCLLESLPKF